MRLYHNPQCSKSRAALDLLQARGLDIEVVDYLQHPPSPADLRDLLARLGTTARDLVRTGEAEYESLGLDAPDVSEEELIQAMSAHPRLIERPILVSGDRAVIGRPPERVLELVDTGSI